MVKNQTFESAKNNVEKMFLKGSIGVNNKYLIFYKAFYGGADINYSLGDCEEGAMNIWNIPEWTVTKVLYLTQDDPPELKKLLKDLGKYKTRPSGHQMDLVEYYNEEKGISITYDTDDKKVIEIEVEPTLKQKNIYDCSLIKRNVN